MNRAVTAYSFENVSTWHIPILAMTADVIQATSEECLKCGMDGYVPNHLKLINSIRKFLAFSL